MTGYLKILKQLSGLALVCYLMDMDYHLVRRLAIIYCPAGYTWVSMLNHLRHLTSSVRIQLPAGVALGWLWGRTLEI